MSLEITTATLAQQQGIRYSLGDPSTVSFNCGPSYQTLQLTRSAIVGASILVLGDSMSNDFTAEWFGLLAADIALSFPTHRVMKGEYNTTNNDYTWTTLQVGTAQINGVAGEQRYYYPAAGANNRSIKVRHTRVIEPVSADLEFIIDIQPETSWATARVGNMFLGGIFGGAAANSRCALWLTAANTLYLQGFSVGGANSAILQSTALPLTGSERIKFRARYTANTGGGNYSCLYSYSTNGGTTWTNMGAATTGASVTFAQGGTFPVEVGAYGDTSSPCKGFYIYRFEMRDGIAGPLINPQSFDDYEIFSGTDTNLLQGSPTIYLLNASQFGWAHATWVSEGLSNVIQDWGHGPTIVCLGYNEALTTGEAYLTTIETITPTIAARRKRGQLIQCVEPFTSADTASPSRFRYNLERAQGLVDWCRANNAGLINFHEAFRLDGRGNTLFDADGIHPNAAGEAVMSNAAAIALGI